MDAPLPERTVRDLTGMLVQAAHAMNTRLSLALAEIDSSPRKHCVLLHALEGGRTQSQLAAIAGLDKTTMVVTADELERDGLAERHPSATDRRVKVIHVTPAGAELVRRGEVIVDRVHGEALGELSAGERQVFVDALDRLQRSAELPAAGEAGGVRKPRRARQG
ncbi:MarR family transcriptional regulator [Kitasatospora sp. YST-16]|uniref:MarR family winged helix-turn-helix transcriptional regulator n=1 Tax=Kitasatospora sp. YST-16 TaxID=2998080 RepID=UPI0022843B69|nr:MarR family transcriptional regulator [Kitasatospora sp. YST-16]WAL73933.1 MarR family transcriptional regulator [Kitasatospora sp. YST-16]WNW40007.1 MarR family transcriptional regulator [Streptomyces sp. Li-HN-5-13]